MDAMEINAELLIINSASKVRFGQRIRDLAHQMPINAQD